MDQETNLKCRYCELRESLGLAKGKECDKESSYYIGVNVPVCVSEKSTVNIEGVGVYICVDHIVAAIKLIKDTNMKREYPLPIEILKITK